jgi:hypothetical protein
MRIHSGRKAYLIKVIFGRSDTVVGCWLLVLRGGVVLEYPRRDQIDQYLNNKVTN